MENFQDTFEIGRLSFINGFFNLDECTFNTLIGRPAIHPQQVTVTLHPRPPTPPREPFVLQIVNTTPKRMKCLFSNLFRKKKHFSP